MASGRWWPVWRMRPILGRRPAPRPSPNLTVRAADWPHGLRCGQCSRLLEDGDGYAERLTGMIGDTPAVTIVCRPCGRDGRRPAPRPSPLLWRARYTPVARDPRPVIAARLDADMRDLLLGSGRAQTVRLLNERIPEGAPWSADWHEPDRFGNVLTVKSGAVTAWLARGG